MKKLLIVSCTLLMSLILSSCRGSSTESSQNELSEEPTHDVCPHCNGAGERLNNVTGVFGTCNSCEGKGIVLKGHNLAE
jgi:DnaJ-class molecular chaperone